MHLGKCIRFRLCGSNLEAVESGYIGSELRSWSSSRSGSGSGSGSWWIRFVLEFTFI